MDTLQARAADPAYGGFFAGITDPHSPRNNSTVAGSETILLAHAAGNNTGTGFGSTTCNTGSDGSNQTAPGEFGWLPLPAGGGNCTANVGSTYIGSTGSNGQDCSIQFTASRNNLQPIYIPVFATISGSGSNTTYTLDGYAAFVVTGWNVHGWSNGGCTSSADSIITGNDSSLNPSVGSPYTNTACSYSFNRVGTSGPPPPDYADYCRNYMGVNCGGNSQQAIYGYFTQALIPASQLPGGGGGGVNLGATTVSLSG